MDPITIQTDELIKWGTFGLKAASPLLAWLVTWRVGKWFFSKVQNRRVAKEQIALDAKLHKSVETLTQAEKAFGISPWAELYDHVRHARDISLKEALIFEFCKKHRKSDIRPLSVCGADLFLDLLKEKTIGYGFQKVSNELVKFIISKPRRERKQRCKSNKSVIGQFVDPPKRRSKHSKKTLEELMSAPVQKECNKYISDKYLKSLYPDINL